LPSVASIQALAPDAGSSGDELLLVASTNL
jgi:hypothetical protein